MINIYVRTFSELENIPVGFNATLFVHNFKTKQNKMYLCTGNNIMFSNT